MAAEYDDNIFDIVDLYDIRLKEYEEYCKEYYEKDEEGWFFGDDEDEEDRDDSAILEEYRKKLFGDLARGEVYVLVKYKGNAETVAIPECVAGIGSSAFSGNAFLRSVYVPDTVRWIGSNAFDGCTALCDIRLSESLGSIKAETFRKCTELTSVTIPDGVEAIGINAFDGCKNLKNVRLGKSLKVIGWDAFARCKSLKSVCLPEQLERIELNVFYDSGLEEIYIPKNVKSLSGSAFLHCDKLNKVVVDPENPYYYSRDNCVYHTRNSWLIVGRNDGTLPDDGSFTFIYGDSFANNPFVKELIVPKSVERIDSTAFRGCVNLKRVVFPDTLQAIGRCAFEGCTALEEVVIPGSVNKIEGLAFWESGVKKVVIKRGVEKIEGDTFGKCPNLREIYIPSSVREVWHPIGIGRNKNAEPVRVYIEASDDKYYEKWIDQFKGHDVILGYKSDIFD